MKIAISSDMYHPLLETLFNELLQRGHTYVYFGPRRDEESIDWPDVTQIAAKAVAAQEADEAIVFCWTGTGASICANKFKGIRAALCTDAETAKGARIYNHANVLALSLRLTSNALLKEILDAWFETSFGVDDWNQSQVKKIQKLELAFDQVREAVIE